MFVCPFNAVPVFGFILIILAFGIAYVTTKHISNGFFAAFLVSSLVVVIYLSANSSGYVDYLLASTVLAVATALSFMFGSTGMASLIQTMNSNEFMHPLKHCRQKDIGALAWQDGTGKTTSWMSLRSFSARA